MPEKAEQKSIPATLAHALARCAKESYSVIWGPSVRGDLQIHHPECAEMGGFG